MAYDLTILVPVYNEQATLPKLLKKLGAIQLPRMAQLIIVNDGSTDKSQEIIDSWIKNPGLPFSIKVIQHKTNKGKGAGIQTALGLAKGTYFVVQDADLEYNPAEIPQLLKVALSNDAPVVYGSRFLGSIKNMPWPNYWGNRLYNLMLRLLYGVRITDMHTCYKMLRTDLFKSLNIHSMGFGYATEVISKLLRQGISIKEVPISYNGRSVKKGKKITATDGLECLWQIVQYRYKHEL